MLLPWKNVDDVEVAAITNEYIFRLKKDKDKWVDAYKEASFYDILKLQVRKKSNINFYDLGYKFLIKEYYSINKENYVDAIVWKDVIGIIERAEEILIVLGYIEISGD